MLAFSEKMCYTKKRFLKGFTSLIYAVVLLLLVLTAAFLTSGETALSYANHVHLKALAESGKKTARYATLLLKYFDTVLVTLLSAIHLVYSAVASVATLFFHSVLTENAPVSLIASLVTTVVIFLFCENIPKNIARENCDRLAMWFSIPILVLTILLLPLSILITLLGALAKKIFANHKEAHVTQEELEAAIQDAATEGILPTEESTILTSALHFEEYICRSVFTPMDAVDLIDITASTEQLLALLKKDTHTRIPVCDGAHTQVVGILHTENTLLAFYRAKAKQKPTIAELMLPPLFVEADEKLSDALAKLRAADTSFAIVCEKDGSAIGVLTIEDILSRICGALSDEGGAA